MNKSSLEALLFAVQYSCIRVFKNIPGEVIKRMPQDIRDSLKNLKSSDIVNPRKEDIYGSEQYYESCGVSKDLQCFDKLMRK